METKFTKFKKKRDLEATLSDSFTFLKNEFKPLLATFFKIIAPYILTMALGIGFYFYALSSFFDANETASNEEFIIFGTIILAVIVIVSGVITAVMSQSSILYYIEDYITNNGKTNFLDIKKKVYQNFWSFLGLGTLVILSILAGFLFCFFPGIYLYVPLSLTFAIYVFSGKAIMDSYSYSFTLVKNEWWMTFATLFTIAMIVGIVGYVFSMPVTIYSIIKPGISTNTYDPVSSQLEIFKDPIYVFLYLIAIVCRLAINIITIIAGVLIYFNLNEKKNLTGTYERIKNLGQNPEN